MKISRNSIKQIIKETLENAESFETVLDKFILIKGLENHFKVDKDTIDYDCNFSVIWRVEMESRTWGIKSITPVVNSVRGQIFWKIDKEYLEEDQLPIIKELSDFENEYVFEGTLEISSLNPYKNKKWIILDEEFKITSGGELFPNELEIDFNKMEINIY